MEWNIGIQIFKISVMSDNMNWLDNNLILHRNIEYLQISFHSGKYIEIPIELKLKLKNGFPSSQNIIDYWQSLQSSLNQELKELKPYKLNQDYYLAPIYIMKKMIILGVFIPDSHTGKILFSKLSNTSDTSDTSTPVSNTIFGFMSNITNTSGFNPNTKLNYNTYNIIAGILEYLPFPDKYLVIQKYRIHWKNIIANIRNYLPKIKITYLPPKTSSIDFFRNRLNPSH